MKRWLVRRLARFALDHRAWLRRLLPLQRTVLVRLPEFSMYVRLDDWVIGARIALRRRYEPHVTAAMRPLLRPGTVMVDVGANVGYHSLMAASRVGRVGKVIAFEPASDNCALLTRSLGINGFVNVVLYPFAVADMNGLVGFEMDDSNGGINPGDPFASAMQVRGVTLDALLADEPRIDVIKMDIEGSEGRALRGMRALLRRHHPVLFTEFFPSALASRSGMSGEEYLNELRELGYLPAVIDWRHGPSRVAQTNTEILAQVDAGVRGYADLVARPLTA